MDKNLLIDTCSVYCGAIDLTNPDITLDSLKDKYLGLTRGGVSLTMKPNIKEIDFDGKMDRKVKGMSRILGWEISAGCETLEIQDNLFELSQFKKITTSSEKYQKFIPSTDITYTDTLLVGTLSSTNEPVLVHLKNTFNSEGFSIETKDKDEAGVKLNLNAHYAINSNEPPVDIYIPKNGQIQKVSIDEVA